MTAQIKLRFRKAKIRFSQILEYVPMHCITFIVNRRKEKKENGNFRRGGEWYLEKRGSRKTLAGSRNLGNVFDKSRSFVFAWFVYNFLSLETF